jgi:uncharacterized membrane protein
MPNPKSTAQIAGYPIHPMLIPFPIACFDFAEGEDHQLPRAGLPSCIEHPA